MKSYEILMMIISFLKTLCNSAPCTRIIRDKNIKTYRKYTGEPVAVAHLIRKYELDHVYLFNKEINKNQLPIQYISKNKLEWKDLANKDLDDYCRRYLQQCVPGRSTYEATGEKSSMLLRYTTPGYDLLRSSIDVVHCTISLSRKLLYHITRALEPNCVYALNRAPGSHGSSCSFTIIYKHCNFELHDYIKNRKQKRISIKKVNRDDKFKKQFKQKCSRRHRITGQFIADDESILKYELEYQEMYKREGTENIKHWPFVTQHRNLNEYCYKYLNLCTPNRKIERVEGSWRLRKVMRRSNKKEYMKVVVVKCLNPVTYKSYYFMRALATNCVYALLRDGRRLTDLFLIIFKYCNFDHPNFKQEDGEEIEASHLGIKKEASEYRTVAIENIIHHENVKTEDLPMDTMQLFSNN